MYVHTCNFVDEIGTKRKDILILPHLPCLYIAILNGKRFTGLNFSSFHSFLRVATAEVFP